MFLNYIKGERKESISKRTLAVYEPATAQEYTQVTRSNSSDALEAIAAAHEAFPRWSKTPARERAQHLRNIAHMMQIKMKELRLREADS